MPVFTPPISTQNIAGSGGVYVGPSILQMKQFSIFEEKFNRSTLNPSSQPSLYTVTNGSTGSSTIIVGRTLDMVTAATLNDTENVALTGTTLGRVDNFVDKRGQVEINVIFSPVTVTKESFFIGLHESPSVSAMPGNSDNVLGIQYVTAGAAANFKLVSGNGTTLITTDTGVLAVASTNYRLQIVWNGSDTATLNLYTGTNYTTLSGTVAVTSFVGPNGSNSSIDYSPFLQFFLIAGEGAIKHLYIREYNIICT